MGNNKKDHTSRIESLESWKKTANLKLNFLIAIVLFIVTQLGLLIFFIIRLFTEKILGG